MAGDEWVEEKNEMSCNGKLLCMYFASYCWRKISYLAVERVIASLAGEMLPFSVTHIKIVAHYCYVCEIIQ